MSVMLVTYDLHEKGKDYKAVLDYIHEHPCTKVSESSYVIETIEAPSAVCKRIRELAGGNNDVVLAFQLNGPYYGYTQPSAHEWLQTRLTLA